MPRFNQVRLYLAGAALAMLAMQAKADLVTPSVFASGVSISATSPDSITFGDGSLWVSYQNGADSTGASGSSTVVRYTPSGSVVHTWSISGNVDGLRIDPSGKVWALQNNDGNSALTVIDPQTNAATSYTYGSTYTAHDNSLGRGFDDVQFLNGGVYLSETNPATGTDPVIVKLTTPLSSPSSPLQIAPVLDSTFTGTNLATGTLSSITITDSDSLILDPAGDLVLTGEADQKIVFVHNPGAMNQTESYLALLGTDGKTISGFPDDTVFPMASSGTFYLADTGANKVYALSATGLTPGSVFIDVGNEFGELNTITGVVTPLFTGVSPHGVTFVPSPEPASFIPMASAVLALLVFGRRNRRMAG
jgi:hypothetical protein